MVAMAIMDQNENTERCELKNAQDLLGTVRQDRQTETARPAYCAKAVGSDLPACC